VDPSDSGDDAGAGDGMVAVPVHPEGGQRAQLEEGAAGVEQPIDPVPRQELASTGMPGTGRIAAAAAYDVEVPMQLGDQLSQISHVARLAIINLRCHPSAYPVNDR
jgi:hypothetical protein